MYKKKTGTQVKQLKFKTLFFSHFYRQLYAEVAQLRQELGKLQRKL